VCYKVFRRFDDRIMVMHPQTSKYTLDLPNMTLSFPTPHASKLKQFHENDDELFPGRRRERPDSIVGKDGIEEYAVEEIIDSRRRGRGWQFLVRWVGTDWKKTVECEAVGSSCGHELHFEPRQTRSEYLVQGYRIS